MLAELLQVGELGGGLELDFAVCCCCRSGG